MMQRPHDGEIITPLLTEGMYDLEEQTEYLYVHVVKARDLPPTKDVTGSDDPYVEVRIGKDKGSSRDFEKKSDPGWNRVFAFFEDRIQTSVLEVMVRSDEDVLKDDFVGCVLFDLSEVPKRVELGTPPPAAEWFNLKDRKGDKSKGELMVAVWWGTQADEAFPEAWHSDAAAASVADLRSKVYFSPKLWYLRVQVIEVQELIYTDTTRTTEVFVKASFGKAVVRVKMLMSGSSDPTWNDNLLFVAAEPFEVPLILSVEDRVTPYQYEVLGMCSIDLRSVERRFDDKAMNTKWFNLEKDVIMQGEEKSDTVAAGRLHLGIWLEGGYHVTDTSINHSSDLRPTEEKLWTKSIGVLELGIFSAHGLSPTKKKDGSTTTNAYCVAKYGRKWVRTRTITDNFSPKWNEQYTWEVFDPCTVITIGVFDNCHLQGADNNVGKVRDLRIGMVRIRLSTLETDCIYSHAYPLSTLRPSGVKKMGEIFLAVRFSCSSRVKMMHTYSQTLLPKMHYLRPISEDECEILRFRAAQIISMRLGQAEPPLRKEVVECMLDVGCQLWSMRTSKAIVSRVMRVSGSLVAVLKQFDEIRNWKHPTTTILTHIILIVLVLYPVLILPSVFLYLFLVGVWNRSRRPMHPPRMDTYHISWAESVDPDELDEEFDSFPTSQPSNIVRMRYDRLRSICGSIQIMAGDLVTQGERLESLLSWRDPRATTLFMIFCLIAAIVLYAKPFYAVAIQTCVTVLSHPRFQHNLPLIPVNFFRRLPSRTDCML